MSIFLRAVVFAAIVAFGSCLPHTASAGTVYACFHKEVGNLRYVDGPEECLGPERVLTWDDGSGVGDALSDLQDRMSALEGAIQSIAAKLACVSDNSDYTNVYFEGCNVHVRNTTGDTAIANGFGNLIVGYDEGTGDKSGSHNLVVGPYHSYPSYGGFVAGFANRVTAPFASISGGRTVTMAEDYGWAAGDVSWNRLYGFLVDTNQIDMKTSGDFLLDSNRVLQMNSLNHVIDARLLVDIDAGAYVNIDGEVVRFNGGARRIARMSDEVSHNIYTNEFRGFILDGSYNIYVP